MTTAAGVWRELHPGRFVSGEAGAAAGAGEGAETAGWVCRGGGSPLGGAALNQGSFVASDREMDAGSLVGGRQDLPVQT